LEYATVDTFGRDLFRAPIGDMYKKVQTRMRASSVTSATSVTPSVTLRLPAATVGPSQMSVLDSERRGDGTAGHVRLRSTVFGGTKDTRRVSRQASRSEVVIEEDNEEDKEMDKVDGDERQSSPQEQQRSPDSPVFGLAKKE